MKIHLRIIALVLALMLFVYPLATAEEIPEMTTNAQLPAMNRLFTVDETRLMLEKEFESFSASLQEQGSQLWYSIFFNEEKHLFIIEFAIDGVAEGIFDAIDAGYNESYEPWVHLKEGILMLYGGLAALLGFCENPYLKLWLQLENDTMYFDEEWCIPYYYELYSITNGSISWDVMKIENAPMPTRAPESIYGY